MSRPAPARLVLWMEGRRLARRPSTWLVRGAWAAALAATIVLLWTTAVQDPRVDAARLGHRLFDAYCDLVLLLAVGLAPVLVAVGAAEDRDDGNVALLGLAGLGARRVLVGRASARLLALWTVILGGLPIAALLAAMGGVGPWALLNATANALALMVALGVVAGALAGESGRVFAPVLGALTWGWLAFFALPSLLEYALYSEVFLGWRGQGFLLRWLEVVTRFGFGLRPGSEVLSPVAAMRTESAAGLLPLVPVLCALGVVALAAWSPRAWRAVVVVGAPLGVGLWVFGLRRPEAQASPVLWVGALVLLVGGTAVFLEGGRWLLEWRGERVDRPARRLRGDPVLWRDLATRGWSGTRPWAWWAGALWSAALLAGWWTAPGSHSGHLAPATALWVVGVIGVALAGTASVAVEVGEGTWPLLVALPRPTRQLVAAKLLGAGVYGLPVLLLAAALRGMAWLPAALALGVAVALASMAGALWVRPRRLAWMLNLGGAAVLVAAGARLPLAAMLPVTAVLLVLAPLLFVAVTWSVAHRA